MSVPKTRLKQKIGLIALGVVLCAIILEFGLRIGGFLFLSSQEHRNRISIEQKGDYRILCLGDSTTTDLYPFQLNQILSKQNMGIKFIVINKGIPGNTTRHIIAQLEDNLNKYNPNMVIAMMGIDDLGDVVPYGDNSIIDKVRISFSSLRIYKLANLIRLHIISKAQEIGIYKPSEDIAVDAKALTQISIKEQEEVLKKIIQTNPNDDKAYFELGFLYRDIYRRTFSAEDQERSNKAKEMYKKAIRLNPQNDKAYIQLGWWYSFRDISDHRAGEMFKKAIEANPQNARGYMGLAEHYAVQGFYGRVEELYKKAIQINPKIRWAYPGLSSFYRRVGDYKLAEEYSRKANKVRLESYLLITRYNYQKLKEIITQRGITLVCMQYPLRNVESLKRMLKPHKGIIFIDNEEVFKQAIRQGGYDAYFVDMFAGDFGHCTKKGNKLIAENVASVILKEVFKYE